MKFMKQFMIILIVSFLGEALNRLLPLPVPAGIYALVLLFLALLLKVVPLAAVEQAADFLLGIMQLMFLPAMVGLMVSIAALGKIWLPAVILIGLGSVVVMGATGHSAQLAQKLGRRARK